MYLFPFLVGANLAGHANGRRGSGIRGVATCHQQGGAFHWHLYPKQGKKRAIPKSPDNFFSSTIFWGIARGIKNYLHDFINIFKDIIYQMVSV
jgi:hypothetical protein